MVGLVQAIILGLAFGGVFALITAGLTLIFALTRHINVAHGSFMVLGMYIIFAAYRAWKLDPYLALLILAPLMFLLGLFVFRLGGFSQMIKADPLIVFQFFIGYVLIIENILLLRFSGDYQTVPSFITLSKTTLGPFVMRNAQLLAFLASLAVSLGFYWVLMNTEFGRAVRAVAQNPDVAALMGVNVRRVRMLVFALGFVLLAVAAALFIPLTTFNPYTGFILTLFALIILVMGGMGSFLGALVAGLIIGLAYGISYFYVGSSLAAVIPYGLFILVILLRPQGIFGIR